MDLPVSFQLQQALVSLAAGLAAGIVYDALAALRAVLKKLRALPDLLFCAFLGITFFQLGIKTGGGRLRIFMLAFMLLAMLAYFALSGGRIRRFFGRLYAVIVKFAIILSVPVKKFFKILKKFEKILKKLFKSVMERCKLYDEAVVRSINTKVCRKAGVRSYEAEKIRDDCKNSNCGSCCIRNTVSYHYPRQN